MHLDGKSLAIRRKCPIGFAGDIRTVVKKFGTDHEITSGPFQRGLYLALANLVDHLLAVSRIADCVLLFPLSTLGRHAIRDRWVFVCDYIGATGGAWQHAEFALGYIEFPGAAKIGFLLSKSAHHG